MKSLNLITTSILSVAIFILLRIISGSNFISFLLTIPLIFLMNNNQNDNSIPYIDGVTKTEDPDDDN